LVRTGLSDEVISQLADYESSDLDESWKAALRLADHLSGSSEGVLPVSVYDDLRGHFSEPQILMLGSLLAVGSGWQRMIEAFGIRPDHFVEGRPGPWVTEAT